VAGVVVVLERVAFHERHFCCCFFVVDLNQLIKEDLLDDRVRLDLTTTVLASVAGGLVCVSRKLPHNGSRPQVSRSSLIQSTSLRKARMLYQGLVVTLVLWSPEARECAAVDTN